MFGEKETIYMIIEKIIFLILVTVLIGVLIRLTYKTNRKSFPTMYIVTLLVAVAFYLFQYGALGSFHLKVFSATANFVKEKKEEVERDADAIAALRNELQGKLAEMEKNNLWTTNSSGAITPKPMQ